MTKIYVVRTEAGSIIVKPSKPTRSQELVVKINKPWNPYYVSRVKSYFERTASRMYVRRR